MVEFLKELKNEGEYTSDEITEEMNKKFKGIKFTKTKVKVKWQNIGGDKIKKKIVWTSEMENYLRELKAQNKYTSDEIAEEMNEKFKGMKFNYKKIKLKWQKIGGDKIKKYVIWDSQMEARLEELWNKKEHTWAEIAKKMNEEFPKVHLTEEIVNHKWARIKEKKSSKSIKGSKEKIPYVKWTEEMVEFLKESKKTDKGKKLTNEKIVQHMNKKFTKMSFTVGIIREKWQKIGGDEIKKKKYWTSEMEKRLKALKNKNKSYKKIAEIMTKEFSEMIFTIDSVTNKWQKIGGDKTKKKVIWTTKMEAHLKKLKNEEECTWAEITKKMNNKFPDAGGFTKNGVKGKWQSIKG